MSIVFTQHALERYMQRAKVRNVQTAMDMMVFLAERVRPIAEGIFTYEDSALIVDSEGVIQTYYKLGRSKRSKLECGRNLKLISKALAL